MAKTQNCPSGSKPCGSACINSSAKCPIKPTLHVQSSLRDGSHTLATLKSDLGITARPHSKWPNLVCLKYSQIDSPRTHPIVIECRGIVLDSANDWAVVSRPFDRFFNLGEAPEQCASFDWSSYSVYEKLDGSLMTLYWYDNAWQVQSSGTADAAGQVGDSSLTLADLFWRTFNALGYRLPPEPTGYCYMFELCCPENQVVVLHELPSLTLIGKRYLASGNEQSYDYGDLEWQLGWDLLGADFVGAMSPEAVQKMTNSRPGALHEGYVLCDGNYNRIKVKSAEYLLLHRTKAKVVTKLDLLELVLANEQTEFATYFPQHAEQLSDLAQSVALLVHDIEHDMHSITAELGADCSQKAFAQAALARGQFQASVLFTMRKTGQSANYCIRNGKADNLLGEILRSHAGD